MAIESVADLSKGKKFRGIGKPRHVALAVSLYPDHGVALVTVDDPRSDGRPRRLLAGFRIPLGYDDLVGRPPLDSSLLISQALTEALSDACATAESAGPRHPRRGSRGRPEFVPGQMQLPFG